MRAERLLQRVIAAHGGNDRWRRVKALHVHVRCGGAALAAAHLLGPPGCPIFRWLCHVELS